MTKDYPLAPIAGFPASAKLTVDASTDADVLAALAANSRLPARDLALGRIGVDFAGKTDTPIATPHGKVTIGAKASGRLGVGICDKSSTLLAQLALADASDLKLAWDDIAGQRYAYLVAGYEVGVSAAGKHPVGAVGSATFAVEGKQALTFATVARFSAGDGANDVLVRLVKGWCLPATITDAKDLPAGTAVLVEVDASFGLKLGAQLGYDFSFVRAVQAGGLSGDVGLKVATALSTQIGFSASGKFLLCVERATAAESLRLRLFKQRKAGWSFALDLKVGATPVAPLPDSMDDFVEVVFGVHGKQVIADLKKLEAWTDPANSTGELVAGLVNKKALALIKDTTGIDPEQEFTKARKKFIDGVDAWQALPGRTSAWLWRKASEGLEDADRGRLLTAMKALAAGDDDAVKKLVAAEVSRAGFDQDFVGQFVDSLADEGVLALLERAPAVRDAAKFVQQLLEGDFLQKLQGRIAKALDLDQIIRVVTERDWETVDGWLLERLSEFFGEKLQFNKLAQIRGTLHAVVGKRDQLYRALHEAITKTYEAKFAYAYESATTRTALIDATFDFGQPSAQAAYARIVGSGDWEALFLAPIAGVQLASGVLTHGISRNTSIQLTLPMFTSNFTNVVSSLAKLEVHAEGAELVGTYSLNASDEVKSVGRYQSRLVLAASHAARAGATGGLRVHGESKSSWSYVYRYVRASASLPEMQSLLAPIQQAYFPAKFAAPAKSFDRWLLDFDRQIEGALNNGRSNFGDVLVSFELTMPGALTAVWFEPRSESEQLAAQCSASRAIQRSLRNLLLQSYVRNLDNLMTTNVARFALLVYASLPVANELIRDADEVIPSTENYYWDWVDARLVWALARSRPAISTLTRNMEEIRVRLEAEGHPEIAAFYASTQVERVINGVSDPATYSDYLRGLLFVEAEIIRGTAKAITSMARYADRTESKPAEALAALAEFGAAITQTFNGKLKSIYLPSSLRSIGTALFCEVTLALGRLSGAPQSPRALLALTVLRPGASFELGDFLKGKEPTVSADVAGEQRLAQRLGE